MEAFYDLWRRRFAVHAALLMAASIVVGFQYFGTLDQDEPPFPSAAVKCAPLQPPGCPEDDPYLPDTVLEHRWRMAHEQGLQHALLLFGYAIGVAYFRIGRFFIKQTDEI